MGLFSKGDVKAKPADAEALRRALRLLLIELGEEVPRKEAERVDDLLERLDRYPTPGSARLLGEKRLANFLSTNGYSGGRILTALLARLRDAPAGLVGEIEERVKGELVRSLVAMLLTLVEHLKRITIRVEHRDRRRSPTFPN